MKNGLELADQTNRGEEKKTRVWLIRVDVLEGRMETGRKGVTDLLGMFLRSCLLLVRAVGLFLFLLVTCQDMVWGRWTVRMGPFLEIRQCFNLVSTANSIFRFNLISFVINIPSEIIICSPLRCC